MGYFNVQFLSISTLAFFLNNKRNAWKDVIEAANKKDAYHRIK